MAFSFSSIPVMLCIQKVFLVKTLYAWVSGKGYNSVQKILFLIGARGCGKSTVGLRVAKRLDWHFMDTDAVVQERLGCSVADMVARESWQAFRAAESAALQACVQENKSQHLVLATGGGMVLAPENRAYMREQGLVCFLHVPEKMLVQRLVHNPQEAQRPSLTGQDVASEVRAVLQERLPLYEGTAHSMVDASLPIAQVVENIYSVALRYSGWRSE